MLRLFGHPVHAMLVSLPLGTLALVPVWDVLAIMRLLPQAAAVGYCTATAGLIAAGLAVLSGVGDLLVLSERPRLLSTGFRHALLAFAALGTLGVSLALRSPMATPGYTIALLDAVGAALLLASAWFGGHLVFHHGVGVDESVHAARRPSQPSTDEVTEGPIEHTTNTSHLSPTK